MKHFIKQFLYFILSFLLINLLFYKFIFNPAILDNYIFNKNKIKDYNLFLVGDSHGAYLADVPGENKIFNFSNTSENYLDMYLKVKYLTTILTKDDTILLEIDNHGLSSYRNGFGRVRENIIYVNDFAGIEDSAINWSFYFKKYTKFIPMLEPIYNKSILKYISLQLAESNNSDDFSKVPELEKNKLYRARFVQQFFKKEPSYQQKKYLIQIIELCRQSNITLIGIKFPITKGYWNIIKEEDFGIDAFWRSNNLPFLDFHDLFFDKDNFFCDVDHLNNLGALNFCKEIQFTLSQPSHSFSLK
jgi:hypothetical protein